MLPRLRGNGTGKSGIKVNELIRVKLLRKEDYTKQTFGALARRRSDERASVGDPVLSGIGFDSMLFSEVTTLWQLEQFRLFALRHFLDFGPLFKVC